MAGISCNLRFFVFLLSLAAMIRFLDATAGNVEMDEYLEKQAQKALEDSVRSYASNPEWSMPSRKEKGKKYLLENGSFDSDIHAPYVAKNSSF